MSDQQIKSSGPQACFHSTAGASPEVSYNFCLIWLQIGDSYNLPRVLLKCWSSSQNSGKHLFPSLLKNMIKDTDEQADKEIYSAKSGSLWHKRVCPHSIWGHVTLSMYLSTWKLLKTHNISTVWRLPHTVMTDPSSTFSPSPFSRE